MAATRMVGDTEGGAAVAGGYLSWKRSESHATLALDSGAYSHVHTHKHTTHLGTGTAKGITANGEVHVTTLNTACSARRRGLRSGDLPRRTAVTLRRRVEVKPS